MKEQTITQQEISQLTGLPQSYVSDALHRISPDRKNGGMKRYDTKEAVEAILHYCESRKQIVAEAAQRKTAKWDSHIAAAKSILEV